MPDKPVRTERTRPPSRLDLWLLVHLAVLFGALAAGLWPQWIVADAPILRAAPLPLLGSLSVGLAICLLLIFPLSASSPARSAARGHPVRRGLGDLAFLLAPAGPACLAAVWLSDASLTQLAWVGAYLLTLLPAATAAAAWLARPAGRSWIAAALLLILAGLPIGWYLAKDFVLSADGEWLWQMGPLTRIWDLAGGWGGAQPLWSWLVWPLAGAAALTALAAVLAKSSSRR
ncbi:MAG: hypothetical protein ACLFUJ_02305 [Phycisphaerae bacterium]